MTFLEGVYERAMVIKSYQHDARASLRCGGDLTLWVNSHVSNSELLSLGVGISRGLEACNEQSTELLLLACKLRI